MTVAAPSLLTRLTATAHLALLWVRSWVRTAVAWLGLGGAESTVHGPRAYRVYIFNESTDEDDERRRFYQELAPRYFDADSWEPDARDLTGWARFRVEVRYVFRNKKYRMVLRPGDKCVFPPYQDASAPACRLPRGVLSARLQGALGSDIDCDVTERVMKYQGPRGDFHAGLGLTVRLQDMFPFDDHADNAQRFTHLRLMDTTARLTDLPYRTNPAMVLRPATRL